MENVLTALVCILGAIGGWLIFSDIYNLQKRVALLELSLVDFLTSFKRILSEEQERRRQEQADTKDIAIRKEQENEHDENNNDQETN